MSAESPVSSINGAMLLVLAGGEGMEFGLVVVQGGALGTPRALAGRLAEVGCRPVDDDGTDTEILLDQSLGEEAGFVDGVDPRRCHQHEARASRRAAASITSSARLRNPVSIPSKAWKNATASASTSPPTTLPIDRSSGWAATLSTRRPRRVGIIISLNSG